MADFQLRAGMTSPGRPQAAGAGHDAGNQRACHGPPTPGGPGLPGRYPEPLRRRGL
jgi:hypothetical protein